MQGGGKNRKKTGSQAGCQKKKSANRKERLSSSPGKWGKRTGDWNCQGRGAEKKGHTARFSKAEGGRSENIFSEEEKGCDDQTGRDWQQGGPGPSDFARIKCGCLKNTGTPGGERTRDKREGNVARTCMICPDIPTVLKTRENYTNQGGGGERNEDKKSPRKN